MVSYGIILFPFRTLFSETWNHFVYFLVLFQCIMESSGLLVVNGLVKHGIIFFAFFYIIP
jgi:hypothetical protein